MLATLAFALYDGFVVNQYGQLSWQGMTDFIRLIGPQAFLCPRTNNRPENGHPCGSEEAKPRV